MKTRSETTVTVERNLVSNKLTLLRDGYETPVNEESLDALGIPYPPSLDSQHKVTIWLTTEELKWYAEYGYGCMRQERLLKGACQNVALAKGI